MSSLTPSRHGLRPSGAFEAAVRRIFLTFSLRLPSSERGETSGRGVDPRRPGRHSASLPLVTRIHRISPETASRGSGFARERGREREGGRAREGWWARTECSWPPPRARAARAPAALSDQQDLARETGLCIRPFELFEKTCRCIFLQDRMFIRPVSFALGWCLLPCPVLNSAIHPAPGLALLLTFPLPV